ncbi:hypothetical protein ACJZ2D_011367 [Fusarium nematophilum]
MASLQDATGIYAASASVAAFITSHSIAQPFPYCWYGFSLDDASCVGQACDGKRPCNTCRKRHVNCYYGRDMDSETRGRPSRRRRARQAPKSPTCRDLSVRTEDTDNDAQQESPPRYDPGSNSHYVAMSGPEQVELHTKPWMLLDPTSRALFVGDSSALSYLFVIRTIVESVAGGSEFTEDPGRFKMSETPLTGSRVLRPPLELPDKKVAKMLVESYFLNTRGLLEIFDRRSIDMCLDLAYCTPKVWIHAPERCLLYLVLAIGLVMGPDCPTERERNIIDHLRSQDVRYDQMLFEEARISVPGLEDGDFWSIQALVLMSFYSLVVSKRNAAYAFCGMGVRSAYGLGLHRGHETDVIFSSDRQVLRRNVWRSLFVLDRFLATSLGRPLAISEQDCAEGAFSVPSRPSSASSSPSDPGSMDFGQLDAAVQACQVVGRILNDVYSKRSISTDAARPIADECKRWTPPFHFSHNVEFIGNDAADAIATLHARIFAYHAMVLLCRPFFLHLFVKKGKNELEQMHPGTKFFSELCVYESLRTIKLVQAAFGSGHLPRVNPFVLYFLFDATTIALSNEFIALHHELESVPLVSKALDIMAHWAHTDPQARELSGILHSFWQVVALRRQFVKYQYGCDSTGRGSLHSDCTRGSLECLVSCCHPSTDGIITPDSRRGSAADTHFWVTHHGASGALDPGAVSPMISPTNNLTPQSQSTTELAVSSQHGDYKMMKLEPSRGSPIT